MLGKRLAGIRNDHDDAQGELADYDPDYARRLHQAKFTESEREELKKYEQYLLWKRKQ